MTALPPLTFYYKNDVAIIACHFSTKGKVKERKPILPQVGDHMVSAVDAVALRDGSLPLPQGLLMALMCAKFQFVLRA